MSIRAPHVLLLDFGAVISRSLFETVSEIEDAFDLDHGTLPWFGPFDPATDTLWQDMQNGSLSEREYWYRRATELSALTNRELTIQEIIKLSRPRIDNICRREATDAIAMVKASGGVTAIATNELLLFYGSERVNASSILSGIDHIFDSSYTKILKPDARAYTSILTGLGVSADEIVFIDDQIRNVDGANKVGIKSIHLDIVDPKVAFNEALDLMQLT